MQKRRLSSVWISALGVIGFPCHATWAQLPAEQTMLYWIRDEGQPEDDPVVLTVQLVLEARSRDGQWTTWQITELRFKPYRVAGTPTCGREEALPSAGTPSGSRAGAQGSPSTLPLVRLSPWARGPSARSRGRACPDLSTEVDGIACGSGSQQAAEGALETLSPGPADVGPGEPHESAAAVTTEIDDDDPPP
jgi:hypothetical protein